MLKKARKNKFRMSLLWMIFASTLLLFSCSDESHLKKLNTYIANLKTSVAKKQKVIPQTISLPAPAIYQAGAGRTPFENSEAILSNKGKLANPLLIYPVNMLKFVGTIIQDNKTIAYLITPDNKLYQVAVGDMVGDNHGKVTQIYADRIEILEQDSIPSTQHVVVLQLKDDTK